MSVLATIIRTGGDKINKINKYSIFIFIVGWQFDTIIHECGHLVAAWAFGYHATISQIGFHSGSTLIYGEIDPTAMVIIAVAGSATLIVIGMALVRACPIFTIVFLGRAWSDMLPIFNYDGMKVAHAAGMNVAIAILFVEIVICAYGLHKAIININHS